MKTLKMNIQYKTKQEVVYDEIKKAIINCELKPSEQLIIRSIATQFNISEIPVREALRRLISEDFVVERGSNLYVASITKIQLVDMLDIRIEIEMIAIKIAVIRSTNEDIEYLKSILDEMKRHYAEDDLLNYDIQHKKLHLAIFDICGICYLRSAVRGAFEHSQRGVNYFKLKSWDGYPSIKDHEEIILAIEEKNVERAQECLLNNRVKAFTLYKNQIHKMIKDCDK